jgi:hypothetical protein
MPTVNPSLLPLNYSPVSAEIWFGLNSASSGTQDFKYIFTINKVDVVSGSSSTLGTYKVPPRPITGDGLFTPHKILRSSMSYNINPFIATQSNATQSISRFNITRGFSFDPNIRFIDIVPYIGTNAWLAISTFSAFDLVAGDRIYLELDNPNVNAQYNGWSTIVSVTTIFGWQYIQINKTYVAGSVPEAGYITQQERINGGTSANFITFNGTRQYEEVAKNFATDYVVQDTTAMPPSITPSKQFLTNYKVIGQYDAISRDNFAPIFSTNWHTLSYMTNPDSFSTSTNWNAIYTFYDDNLNVETTYTPLNTLTWRWDLPAGPRNLVAAGLWPVGLTPSRYSVSIGYEDTAFPTLPPTWVPVASKWFKIISNCSPYGKNWRLAFLNRLGGFDYFNFNWKWQETTSLQRQTWRRQLPPNYTIGTRGDTQLTIKAQKSYIVSSDWVSQRDYEWLRELVSSPEVYLLEEATTAANSKFLPIIITNTSWQQRTTIDNKLFSASVEFRMAYDENIYNY